MKAAVSLLLIFTSFLSAHAQWYLFGGGEKAAPAKVEPAEAVTINLTLPLGTPPDKLDHNFYDFYCGALMAVRELGDEGSRINLNVINTDEQGITLRDYLGGTINLGPVNPEQIRLAAADAGEGYVVSLLDPRAGDLADSLNVISVPVGPYTLVDGLAMWLCEEYREGDTVVIVQEYGRTDRSTLRLRELLGIEGIRYTIVSDVLGITSNGTLRIACVSEKSEFLGSTARNASELAKLNGNTCFYTTSKVRSIDGLAAANLYSCNTRMTASYYIDYLNPEVRRFILSYRALFHTEPSQFAFSGYDTVRYFGKLASEHGKDWKQELEKSDAKGLQSDFRFTSHGIRGSRNTAVRRVVYDSLTSSTTLL